MKTFTVLVEVRIPLLVSLEVEAETEQEATDSVTSMEDVDEATWGECWYYQFIKGDKTDVPFSHVDTVES